MRMRKLVPYGVAVLLAGCVPVFSLHPLYTKETITFEEKLLGTFTDPNKPEDTWEFARLETSAAGRLPPSLRDQAAKCYRVNLTGGTGKGSVVACLVKLQDCLFLDFLPGKSPGGEQNPESTEFLLNAMFFLPVHTFVQVNFSGDQLKIRLTDDKEFKKLLKAEPNAVEYTMVEDRPIVTASTEELQAFLTKHANDDRLFVIEIPLTRKPSSVAR
jgi:hypothetical protein